MKLVREVEGGGGILGAVLQKEPEVEQPGPDDLYRVGTAARILKVLEMPNGNLTVILHGLDKVEIREFVVSEPYFRASVAPLKDSAPEPNEHRVRGAGRFDQGRRAEYHQRVAADAQRGDFCDQEYR